MCAEPERTAQAIRALAPELDDLNLRQRLSVKNRHHEMLTDMNARQLARLDAEEFAAFNRVFRKREDINDEALRTCGNLAASATARSPAVTREISSGLWAPAMPAERTPAPPAYMAQCGSGLRAVPRESGGAPYAPAAVFASSRSDDRTWPFTAHRPSPKSSVPHCTGVTWCQ